MNRKELLKFRKTLLDRRRELLEIIKRKKDVDLGEVEISEDDKVESSIEKDIFFNITSNEENILSEIDHALKRIEKGNFGICGFCGKKIAERRLKSLPWVRYCITCQRRSEAGSKK